MAKLENRRGASPDKELAQMSEARAAEIRAVFERFQRGGPLISDKTIAIEDLKTIIAALGHSVAEAELKDLIKSYRNDTLDFAEYWILASRLDDRGALEIPDQDSGNSSRPSLPVMELRAIFSEYERNVKGENVISTDDLGAVLQSLGHFPTPCELQQFVKEADEDASGSLDFDEFLSLATKLNEVKKLKVTTMQQPMVASLNSAEFDPGQRGQRLMSEAPQTFGGSSSNQVPATAAQTTLPPLDQLKAARRDIRAVIKDIDSRLPKQRLQKKHSHDTVPSTKSK